MIRSWLLYRCRLCGDTFSVGHAPDGERAIRAAEGLEPAPPEWGDPPRLTAYHDCPTPDWVGLGDLAGSIPSTDEC